MAKQQSFITSHAFRVKKAKKMIERWPDKVSIIDREAFVEFFLLEDIVNLYEYRLKCEKEKNVQTRAGEIAKKRNLEKFAAVVNIFKSAVEIAWSQISAGNYKSVWKAIHEHALASAASSLKNLPELRSLAVELLKQLADDALEATGENAAFEEALDDLEDHDANMRRVKDLPSVAEIDEVIKAIERAIPNEKSIKKPKPNIC